jgi:Putative Ig domain
MLRTIGSVTSLVFLMVACGGGGGGAMSAPHDLQYAVGTGEVGSPYGPYSPRVSGTVTGYSVSPALPAGLTLDATSGVISGTPLAASSGTTYTVTASNAAGAATAVLTFEILVPPPTALTYPNPVTGTVSAALIPLVPTLTGHADAFTVFPPLPAGLMLDPLTGIVSGTPTSARLPLTYTVIASNVAGALIKSQILLTVDPPPAGTAVTGVFRSDTVIGLGYVSGAHSGVTDTSGAFTYEEGQGIAFSVGQVAIGLVPTAKTLLTPVDLVAQGTGASNRVLNVVRLLMMLDQDLNINNGIQISAAVTAAAASWAPVDFNTADLPTVLGPIIQQASTADGVSHVLPDAATAQAHLRAGFYCTHSGSYYGTFGTNSTPPGTRGDFTASVFPDGSMRSIAHASDTLAGFDVQTNDAVSPLLVGTFAQSAASPSVSLQGSFADATYLSGTYLADVAGNFQAVGEASVAATYKFTGSYTWTPNDSTTGSPSSGPVNLVMDDSNQVSGSVVGARAGTVFAGTVSGNTFTGTARFRLGNPSSHRFVLFPVSGTYSNTASGIALDGQYSTPNSVVTFSTVGCRVN